MLGAVTGLFSCLTDPHATPATKLPLTAPTGWVTAETRGSQEGPAVSTQG